MSRRRRSAEGRFTVSGPYENDHPAPSVGAGVSVAQNYATKHRKAAAELSYYVRDLSGRCFAIVTKHPDGVITTTSPTEGRSS